MTPYAHCACTQGQFATYCHASASPFEVYPYLGAAPYACYAGLCAKSNLYPIAVLQPASLSVS